MTFILFFAFVVNTGMLVNAKINLQNAADLAAYAGAAQQARTLNKISYLNYEMRRHYKKFLFRYYVLGNMAQDSFPKGPADGPMEWSPNGSPANRYNVPAVCMMFNGRDNYCHMDKLPRIAMPPPMPLDSVTSALINQLKGIETIRLENCKHIGTTNTIVLGLWLYNTDPTLEKLSAEPALKNVIGVVKGLGEGIGLLPRELILRLRIRTLEQVMNALPQTGLNQERAEQMRSSADPMPHERSVNAFFSAYNTLGDHNFDPESIMLDELLPVQGGDKADLLKLKDVKVRFDTYALDFNAAGDCTPNLIPMTLGAPLTVGVQKDPRTLTYYAVRLKANAKVMFSPFGDMELRAYAAAQPFGSRLGPPVTDSDFLREAKSTAPASPTLLLNVAGYVPNLPVFADESSGTGAGWDSKKVSGAMYEAMNVAGTSTLTQEHFRQGYFAAMAPNPWEGNRYNIPNDVGGDGFVHNFDTEGMLALWAPLMPPGKSDSAEDLQAAINELFADLSTEGHGAAQAAKLKDSIKTLLLEYIQQLRTGSGEQQEGFKIVRIQNPVSRPDPRTGGTANITANAGVLITDAASLRTSWKQRSGYSVKLTSFDNLTTQPLKTNGSDVMSNPFPLDAEATDDVPFLKH